MNITLSVSRNRGSTFRNRPKSTDVGPVLAVRIQLVSFRNLNLSQVCPIMKLRGGIRGQQVGVPRRRKLVREERDRLRPIPAGRHGTPKHETAYLPNRLPRCMRQCYCQLRLCDKAVWSERLQHVIELRSFESRKCKPNQWGCKCLIVKK